MWKTKTLFLVAAVLILAVVFIEAVDVGVTQTDNDNVGDYNYDDTDSEVDFTSIREKRGSLSKKQRYKHHPKPGRNHQNQYNHNRQYYQNPSGPQQWTGLRGVDDNGYAAILG